MNCLLIVLKYFLFAWNVCHCPILRGLGIIIFYYICRHEWLLLPHIWCNYIRAYFADNGSTPNGMTFWIYGKTRLLTCHQKLFSQCEYDSYSSYQWQMYQLTALDNLLRLCEERKILITQLERSFESMLVYRSFERHSFIA